MSPNDASPALFRNLHHISLVVENLERSIALLERLGFGPFVAYPPLSDYVRLEVRDPVAFYGLRMRVCEIGAVSLQVIEAKDSNTIYGDFLRQRGEGIFHLGFRVENIDAAERAAVDLGSSVIGAGRRADGSGFAYLDTAGALGVTLLLRQSPSGAPPIDPSAGCCKAP